MDENKETIKTEATKSQVATCLFVILHLIVIAGWSLTSIYIINYPKEVMFHDNEIIKPDMTVPDNPLEVSEHWWFRYHTARDNIALMESVTCTILTSFFTIILYLEWCRRLPKKE